MILSSVWRRDKVLTRKYIYLFVKQDLSLKIGDYLELAIKPLNENLKLGIFMKN